MVGFICSHKNTTDLCETALFSLEVVLQGYRYWAGIGVLQSCESALTHYRLVANHGIYFLAFHLTQRKKPKKKTPKPKLILCLFFFVFLRPHLLHMEVPRLGVLSELQLLAYARATATPDLSRVCDLHHS